MPETKTLTEEELQYLSKDEVMALFVEQLLIDKGVNATDEIRASLMEEINDRINMDILKGMSDEMLDKLNLALDDSNVSDDVIEGIIKESGVDVAKVTEETMIRFRDEYLGKEDK